MSSWEVRLGDSLEVLAGLEAASVDAVVTDPPYGLEFMGREWDRFREDDRRVPGYNGREAGVLGEARPDPRVHPSGARLAVGIGGGQRPTTSRCEGCGKRDQFRKPHSCPDGTGWRAELIDPHAAPPSMLAFQSWCREWARLALRALKPGGYLLAFGGTRTAHRLVCGVEDAGFEIRDTIAWLYGSGFPKSLDVGKAIDAAAGATREVVGQGKRGDSPRAGYDRRPGRPDGSIYNGDTFDLTAPATPDAERWQGWGTALKPAHEPIVLARKPLTSSVAVNVLAHGTGALNVDGCRIDFRGDGDRESARVGGRVTSAHAGSQPNVNGAERREHAQTLGAGRWPANVLMDPEAAAMLDAQTGELGRAGGRPPRRNVGDDGRIAYGNGCHGAEAGGVAGPLDEGGGPSRFFYCAKASSAERNAMELGYLPRAKSRRKRRQQDAADRWRPRARNRHPTVKPVELMRWLVRLVTPPGGLVVDPFTGSGTTGCAAMLERARFVGVERDIGSWHVARARIAWWADHPGGVELVRRLEAEAARKAVAEAGQEVLF